MAVGRAEQIDFERALIGLCLSSTGGDRDGEGSLFWVRNIQGEYDGRLVSYNKSRCCLCQLLGGSPNIFFDPLSL